MDKIQIFLEKSSKVILPPFSSAGENNRIFVSTMMKNVESLGFIFSQKLFNELCNQPQDFLEKFYIKVLPILRKMVGAHVLYTAMYPNFPKQVMEMDECELYINALIHYWSDGQLVPDYKQEERLPLLDSSIKYKIINLGTDTEFFNIFTNLIGSNGSISESDKEIVTWFIDTYRDLIIRYIPESIPYKENLCFLFSILLKYDLTQYLTKNIKTATDVLRIACGLSNGDVSLAKTTKFKKWSRKERKQLLFLLNSCNNPIEDMLRFKSEWIVLLHGLHIGDYAKKFPDASNAANILRNDIQYITFNSRVEKLIIRDPFAAAKLLSERPGEFARRLDKLLRNADATMFPSSVYKNEIIEDFLDIADKVSTPVLLQVFNHFKTRNEGQEIRTFFPKGQVAKMQVVKNDLPPLKIERLLIDGIENTLISRFSNLPSLGKVYVDPLLKSYTVPFSQRSASKQLVTISRGSKIDLPFLESKEYTLRFFIWWKNGKERTDLDLSAILINDKFEHIEDIAYYNLRGGHKKLMACHSGDFVDAPNGISEFIDIDIISATNSGIRYVAMLVTSFTQQPFRDLPECFAGWMTRTKPNSGAIYEPKTVQNKFDLTGDQRLAIPVIFDLVDGKAIWSDLSLKMIGNVPNNAFRNRNNLSLMTQAMVQLNKPNLYDLFMMHAKGRAEEIVDDKKEADIVFDVKKAVEIDDILKNYLA